jgi:hypothetical protein
MSKLKGNEVSLEVNTGTDVAPVWAVVACITSNGLDSASDDIDGGSKCGPETLSGDITWTGSFEGFYEKTPTGTQVSGGELIDMYQAQLEHQWRMHNADDTYYRGFVGTLANYSESVDYNALATFTSDINVKGLLITEAPAP